jgi:hypothetical protein
VRAAGLCGHGPRPYPRLNLGARTFRPLSPSKPIVHKVALWRTKCRSQPICSSWSSRS